MKKRVLSVVSILIILLFFYSVSLDNSKGIVGNNCNQVAVISGTAKSVVDRWKNNENKVRGIFVSGPTAGSERMDDIIQLINESELNAIVLDVKDDSGNISFLMDNDEVIDSGACIPYIKDIGEFLTKLKDNNIYVIARIPCFKDPVLAEAKPELALRTLDGDAVTDASGNAWVNPCKEEVWNYIISIADTCCELGFDEVQLDYVRFPIGQNAEKAWYGTTADDENRQQYITSFLEKIESNVHEYNVPLSADVFGTIIKSTEDSKHVGQDYIKLASSLDVISPMIYPSHYANGEFGIEVPDALPYETIYAALNGSKDALSTLPADNCAEVRPWLQGFTASWVDGYIDYGSEEVRQEIQAVYDAGYDEWIIWNSKCDYSYFSEEET